MKVEFAVQPAVAANRNLTGAIPVWPGCTHQLWFISLYVEPEGFAVVLWDPQSNVNHWRYSLIGVYGRQRLAVYLQWWIVARPSFLLQVINNWSLRVVVLMEGLIVLVLYLKFFCFSLNVYVLSLSHLWTQHSKIRSLKNCWGPLKWRKNCYAARAKYLL
jgi:hypothetical protein